MDNRRYFRYAVYVLEIVVLYLLEGTPNLLPEFYTAKPLLIISAAVSAAAFEQPLFSMFFGVFCGLVIDAGSGGVMGLTSIILAVVCFYEAYWHDKYIRNNIYFVLAYSAVACVSIISLKFLVFYIVPGYSDASCAYVSHYLPRIVYSWACTPVVYVLTMLVSKICRKEKRRSRIRRRRRVPAAQRSGASRRRAKQQSGG